MACRLALKPSALYPPITPVSPVPVVRPEIIRHSKAPRRNDDIRDFGGLPEGTFLRPETQRDRPRASLGCLGA